MSKENNDTIKGEDSPFGGNFVKDGKVYIMGNFDGTITNDVIPELMKLIEKKKEERNAVIEIFINSHGGYGDQLLALISVLNIAKATGIAIVTYNLGIAYSCGSILAIHGDHRLMASHATNLMHLGCCGGINSTFEQLERNTKRQKKWLNQIVQWYVERTKLSKTKILEYLKDDCCYFDAKECLKYGLCDEIIK